MGTHISARSIDGPSLNKWFLKMPSSPKSRFRALLLASVVALIIIYYFKSPNSLITSQRPVGNLILDYGSHRSIEEQIQEQEEQQSANSEPTDSENVPSTQSEDQGNPRKFLGDINVVPPSEAPPVSPGTKELLGVPPPNYFFKTVTNPEPRMPKEWIQSLTNRRIENLKFRIYSHNVKNGGSHELVSGELSWEERVKEIALSMKFHSTETTIFTLQEVYKYQLLDILAQLNKFNDEWAFYGVGRINGKDLGEFVPILYNKNHWDLLYNDTIWLNDKDPRSSLQGWDATYARIASVASLRHKLSNNIINVFNTHFDHVGTAAREGSSELILAKANSILKQSENKWPSFFAGDFNAYPDDECITKIKSEMTNSVALATVGNRYGHTKSTVTGFEGEVLRDGEQDIDYIFAPKYTKRVDEVGGAKTSSSVCDKSLKSNVFAEKADLVLIQFGMLHSKFNGRYMSDHRPIVADFAINPKCS
ncbi:hypothetical protein KGF57_002936 [Candida theae]|uniref:Endonuclease/exonuclease/phosphatase domain-containing protein n=1 Tax=Candida theae TaxID=1198502 RepID=A0AAD5FYC7_9ASCO|nr:uncharacterized protein KGF57_002936 [Candida theae]KAI5957670.1 hypothetical protein KGF57_002936 [Candida theae]